MSGRPQEDGLVPSPRVMRTILAHGYSDIDHDVVWRAVTVDVPQLRRALRPD